MHYTYRDICTITLYHWLVNSMAWVVAVGMLASISARCYSLETHVIGWRERRHPASGGRTPSPITITCRINVIPLFFPFCQTSTDTIYCFYFIFNKGYLNDNKTLFEKKFYYFFLLSFFGEIFFNESKFLKIVQKYPQN